MPTNPVVTLQEVTRENLKEILDLKVTREQKFY
jgi:hypothetical protein